MTTSLDRQPRFVLGLKLRRARTELELGLQEVARRSGLSVSYLSEIEKGKKYPKVEKLLALAEALAIPFDELVSLELDDSLRSLGSFFGSALLKEFPFDLFGLGAGDFVGLLSDDPERAGALLRALVEVGRMYDVEVEHLLFAALRSYQQLHGNGFPELEAAAEAFRTAHLAEVGGSVGPEPLRRILEQRHGYRVDEETLAGDPDLGRFRSVFVPGDRPTLLVNGRLLPEQRAFVLGRELGYRELGLGKRALTSSWVEVESFEQLLNNFRASYFAGAVLIPRARLVGDLEALFELERWDGAAVTALLERYHATPEMLAYRLTEILPSHFGFDRLFFVRFASPSRDRPMRLTKLLNLSDLPLRQGLGMPEHHCGRWPGVRLLGRGGPEGRGGATRQTTVAVQRSRFLDGDAEFFVVSMARPLVLKPGVRSAVSVGFAMDARFKRRVRFWNDPAIPRVEVGMTCERCPLSEDQCEMRAVPPLARIREERRARQRAALDDLRRRLETAG